MRRDKYSAGNDPELKATLGMMSLINAINYQNFARRIHWAVLAPSHTLGQLKAWWRKLKSQWKKLKKPGGELKALWRKLKSQ